MLLVVKRDAIKVVIFEEKAEELQNLRLVLLLIYG